MSQAHELSVTERIAEKASLPIAAYDAFVWMVHTRDNPSDFVAMQREYEVETVLAKLTARNWKGASPEAASRALCGQLNLVLRETLNITGVTRDYEEAKDTGYDGVVQKYLVDIVGQLTVRRLAEEEWFQGNPRIQKLRMPFENDAMLAFSWKRQKHRSTVAIGRSLPPYRVIVPID